LTHVPATVALLLAAATWAAVALVGYLVLWWK